MSKEKVEVPESAAKKSLRKAIEDLKATNPEKFEQNKDALEAQLNQME